MLRSRLFHAALVLCSSVVFSACSGFGRIDYTSPGRAAWQRPDLVIAALEIEAGDRVADVGTGDGYFVQMLSDAVGCEGRVYAADVEPEITERLEARVREEGLDNVVVVLAGFDDPNLPDAGLDLVLVVNTYHHIEDRPSYFAALRGDLAEGGRVAILEPNQELGGILGLVVGQEHASQRAQVVEEMQSAGYVVAASHEFLPVQIFEVFAPAESAAHRAPAERASAD